MSVIDIKLFFGSELIVRLNCWKGRIHCASVDSIENCIRCPSCKKKEVVISTDNTLPRSENMDEMKRVKFWSHHITL